MLFVDLFRTGRRMSSMELFLTQKIETLRNQMVQEAMNESQHTNADVVTLSQKLDRYIVFYQRLIVKKAPEPLRLG
jgi:hypothetical protein